MQRVLDKINQAIDGNYTEEQYDETMEAAIGERLNRFLSIALDQRRQAEEESDTVKSIISDLSHQIKTPLANVLLYAEMMGECDEDEFAQMKQMAAQIQNQAEKLNFLIHALIRSSYMEKELIRVHLAETSIDKVILLACQEVETEAAEREITVEFQTCGWFCQMDAKWTLEAIRNILENAVKYSPYQGRVQIQVYAYEMFYRIDITDFGIGIAENEQGKIFQRFYRSSAVNQIKGLGIGLYLARKIISKQGGYIKLRSKLREGSTFSVFLRK